MNKKIDDEEMITLDDTDFDRLLDIAKSMVEDSLKKEILLKEAEKLSKNK
jgi:hypothetical protein